MYTLQPKKMVIINILDILKKYSDIDHPLTQADIVEKLKKEYYMEVDRKTVKRNLMNLLDLDCGIEYTEIMKKDNKGEDVPICTNWYISREFDDSELRLLIDSLLFSKHIPHTQCMHLIEKIEGLSNVYFKSRVRHIRTMPDQYPENKELFFTIDILDEAISKGKKVSLVYNCYGADKKLHPKRTEPYIINPYQMAAANGRYYLICNFDKYDDIAHLRLDRITKIKILDSAAKPIEKTKEGAVNLPRHMAEHIYMFSGESVHAEFKAKNCIIDQVIDWFGLDIAISDTDGETSLVSVTVNKRAFFCWALQYGPHIEVTKPAEMRAELASAALEMYEKYKA